MEVEKQLTQRERKVVGDTLEKIVEKERPIVILALAMYAIDFFIYRMVRIIDDK